MTSSGLKPHGSPHQSPQTARRCVVGPAASSLRSRQQWWCPRCPRARWGKWDHRPLAAEPKTGKKRLKVEIKTPWKLKARDISTLSLSNIHWRFLTYSSRNIPHIIHMAQYLNFKVPTAAVGHWGFEIHGWQTKCIIPKTGHSSHPTQPAIAFRFEPATPSQQPLNPLGLQSSHPLRPLVRNSGGKMWHQSGAKSSEGLQKCQESDSNAVSRLAVWWLSHNHTPRCESLGGYLTKVQKVD